MSQSSVKWAVVGTDMAGMLLSMDTFTHTAPNDDFLPYNYIPVRRLTDGSVVYSTTESSVGDSLYFHKIQPDGTVAWAITFPGVQGAHTYQAGSVAQFPNGDLFLYGHFGLDHPTSNFDSLTLRYGRFDAATGEAIWVQEFPWFNPSNDAAAYRIEFNEAGEIFMVIWESVPLNRHHIFKLDQQGNVLWVKKEVTTLERPVGMLAPTPDGGVWYNIPYFMQLTRLDTNGDATPINFFHLWHIHDGLC